MRAVVDPNVLVSAYISPHGHPRRILDAADNGDFEMVVSEKLLAELSGVLFRERLRRYGPIEEAREHVARARRAGAVVGDIGGSRVVEDDPKDDYLVALTNASGANYIVSGDPHLKNLPYRRTPRQFVELLESERRSP